MDSQLLRIIYRRLLGSSSCSRPPRCQYPDELIVFLTLLACLCDRSMRWVCDKGNWPLWLRSLPIPSYSQIMRRLQSDSVRMLYSQLHRELLEHLPADDQKIVDGKPLVVGGFSKDPDAKVGHVPNGFARGYKLHLIVNACGVIETFCVRPLNEAESTVARERVLPQLNSTGPFTIRGDASYDSNALYEAIRQKGGRLIAPRRKPGKAISKGRHHDPDRLRAIEELESSREAKRQHCGKRSGVERSVGHLTNLPFGLSPLPNFARRLHRVERWVSEKILLYHWHKCLLQKVTPAA